MRQAFYVIFLPLVIQISMSDHGSGIPLGHYKSKSVTRINFLEKCECSRREFITVEGVAECSWLVTSHVTMWAQICLLWLWLTIVHCERWFFYVPVYIFYCNMAEFSCKSDEYSAVWFLCWIFKSQSKRKTFVTYKHPTVSKCVPDSPNLPSCLQSAD